jgi:hypothetical protein
MTYIFMLQLFKSRWKKGAIFYMLCSKDKKQGHKRIAIELVLTHVFASIGKVRPSAIVID